MNRIVIACIMILAFALACPGCKQTPAIIIKPLKTTSDVPQKLQGVRGALAKAASSGTNAANDIKLHLAAPMNATTLQNIGEDADFIITMFNEVAKQDAELSALQADSVNAQVNWNSERAQLEQQIKDLAEKYEKVTAENHQLKEDLDSARTALFKWLITGFISLASIGAGIGMYLKNLRAAASAGIAGLVGATAAVIVGAIYRWQDTILLWLCIALGVSIVVVGVVMYIEWKRGTPFGNLFRAVDKPAVPATKVS